MRYVLAVLTGFAIGIVMVVVPDNVAIATATAVIVATQLFTEATLEDKMNACLKK